MKTKKLQSIELLLSDARGIYIPRDFINECDLSQWNIPEKEHEEIKQSLADPTNESYWDTWHYILDNAYHTDGTNNWYLYQDGDLYAVCNELLDDEEYLNFYGEERG